MQQFANDLPYLLRRAGALGILQDASKEHALLNMSGSPNRILPLPQIAVAHEDYALFDRLLQAGTPPQLAVSISNTITRDSVLSGTPSPRSAQRASGSGGHRRRAPRTPGTSGPGPRTTAPAPCAPLEAARIMARSGLQPKRTIRFVLFTGEEQGFDRVAQVRGGARREADSIQAVIVLDNGTGAITGQALQGRTDLESLWRAVLAPVARLGVDSVVTGTRRGPTTSRSSRMACPGSTSTSSSGAMATRTTLSPTPTNMAVAADLMQASPSWRCQPMSSRTSRG